MIIEFNRMEEEMRSVSRRLLDISESMTSSNVAYGAFGPAALEVHDQVFKAYMLANRLAVEVRHG